MKEEEIEMLEEYIKHARAFVSVIYVDKPGYSPILLSRAGLHDLTEEERYKLVDGLIEFIQEIRRIE